MPTKQIKIGIIEKIEGAVVRSDSEIADSNSKIA